MEEDVLNKDNDLMILETNRQRIAKDIDAVSQITASPDCGCTRLSYTIEDKAAREYLIAAMENLGLSIKIDGVGNIRARYVTNDNANRPSIMIGSHIDTVPNGGKFDGLVGVVSALEVIRVLDENKIELNNPIELIIFAEEEGSNFGVTLVGSKVLTAAYKLDDLKKLTNDENISAYDCIKQFGLDVDNIENQVLSSEEVKAMIELHIEQGGTLEEGNLSVGIVEAIVGMRVYKITINGISNHAGTTPMNLRRDPMIAAAEIILQVRGVAMQGAQKHTVATVGKINAEPNASNVIAGKVEMFVDIRDVEYIGIETVSRELETMVKELENKHDLKICCELIGESRPVNLAAEVIQAIEETAKAKKMDYKKMNSGAVHDAMMLTGNTKVGMIFVASKDGKSHCEAEFTKIEDIKIGADLLLGTVINLAKE